MLYAHFAIVHGSAQCMMEKVVALTMKAYVTLHNMIVEDKRDSYDLAFNYEQVEGTTPKPDV